VTVQQRRVTGADVALRAGVSRQTVSYVLNDTPNQQITVATRERVLAAAADLSYTPNAAARTLRRGNTDIVLVVVPGLPMSSALASGMTAIVSRLQQQSYSPLVHFEAGADRSALLQCCDRVQPVGLICMDDGYLTDDLVRRLRASGTRGILTLGARSTTVSTVLFDQADTGRVAMEHLAARGYATVWGLAPRDPALAELAAQRLGGARLAAQALGVTYRQLTVSPVADQMADLVAEFLRETSPRPRAILAYNDDYALMALTALLDRGVDVPGEVAVIGCDDTPAAQLFRPRLTTTQMHEQELGHLLADTLHNAVRGNGELLEVSAPAPTVAIRDST
jgi:DNA-binding LacI/PurR family transcriptional regulator